MIIRKAKLNDATAIAQVHVDSSQTTYRGILPDGYINKQSYERQKSNWENSLSVSTEDVELKEIAYGWQDIQDFNTK